MNRKENILLRKFNMINFLRAPIVNTEWDEMVERTKLKEHTSVQAKEFLLRHTPEWKSKFDEAMPSAKNYIENLKKAIQIDSLEDLAKGGARYGVPVSLQNEAIRAMVSVIAFWDTEDSNQELILPKLPGITEMDNDGILHKVMILLERISQAEAENLPNDVIRELKRLQFGSTYFSENYCIYPISPTRCVICFSPYFRAFFPVFDATGINKLYSPLLKKELFGSHFYKAPRMELFTPCEVFCNQSYFYRVKQLTNQEACHINSMLLDMETEEFAFHDINKLKESFWYYDNKAVFAEKKKHNLNNFYK